MGLFDADEIGTWRNQTKCPHSEQNYVVLEIKSIRIRFKWIVLARLIRWVADATGYSKKGDTYDHHAMFIDVKCTKCNQNSVATIEF